LNKLKQIKKEEIMEKVRKAEFVAGNKEVRGGSVIERIEKELKTEFIPELYDKAMEKMFDDKYYEQAVEEEVEQAYVEAKDIDIKLMKDEELPEDLPEVAEERNEKYERELTKSIKK